MFGSTRAAAQTMYDSGRDVLAAMHDRHHGTWHETLTFVQKTTTHRPDGGVEQATWYEAEAPGRLRIDFAPVGEGNGLIFRDGQRHAFEGGRLVDSRPSVNALLLVLADLYHFPVERTASVLDSLGLDLAVVGEGTWEGRGVLIVGADGTDASVGQLWVDAERLLPVRLIRRVGPGGQTLVDAHIGGWQRHDGSWVESDIRIHIDGELRVEELYTEIRVNVPLPDTLWDTGRWEIDEPYWR